MTIDLKDRLILPLDVPTTEQAHELVDELGDAVSFYKIGLQLFPVGGVKLAHDLVADGKKIFLDFKFHDIGNTVMSAVASATSFGATFLTVHGERDVVTAAVKGRGDSALKILAVTVLTSMNEESLAELGIQSSVEDLVLKRARTALEAGCDGVIASAKEVQRLRDELGTDFLIVTPGIRSAGAAHDDAIHPADALLVHAFLSHLSVSCCSFSRNVSVRPSTISRRVIVVSPILTASL